MPLGDGFGRQKLIRKIQGRFTEICVDFTTHRHMKFLVHFLGVVLGPDLKFEYIRYVYIYIYIYISLLILSYLHRRKRSFLALHFHVVPLFFHTRYAQCARFTVGVCAYMYVCSMYIHTDSLSQRTYTHPHIITDHVTTLTPSAFIAAHIPQAARSYANSRCPKGMWYSESSP
jgi:hypothetical protein